MSAEIIFALFVKRGFVMSRRIPFSEMTYERVDLEHMKKRYADLERRARQARTAQDFLAVLDDRYAVSDEMTNLRLAQLRYDMDVNDPYWQQEKKYCDELSPLLGELETSLNRVLLDSPYRSCMAERIGAQAMTMLENSMASFREEQVPLRQEENRLTDEYTHMMANAAVEWEGSTLQRSRMTPYLRSKDRDVRRRAAWAVAESWEAQREQIELLYDKLVHNRDRQAKLAGFPSYAELSFPRMNRIGYAPEDVKAFRDEVKEYLSPVYLRLKEGRRARLGLDRLYYYDSISFADGDPVPLGDEQACVSYTREMYHRISPQTAGFIDELIDCGLIDVSSRPGKRGGGYMMQLEKYRSFFLFARFDHTCNDAYLMSHEGGHAFQAYLMSEDPIREHAWVTMETAETHAMSMEFFAAPHMELFFGDRAEDYRRRHLEGAVSRIAYQCQQDEFQEQVYRNPDMTPRERDDLWLSLEREYLPGRDYADAAELCEGRGWQWIPHMFYWPFYAIDYGLAQAAALEYREWMRRDYGAAWDSYLTLCRESGVKNFRELVRSAGLDDPFAKGTVQKLAETLIV